MADFHAVLYSAVLPSLYRHFRSAIVIRFILRAPPVDALITLPFCSLACPLPPLLFVALIDCLQTPAFCFDVSYLCRLFTFPCPFALSLFRPRLILRYFSAF